MNKQELFAKIELGMYKNQVKKVSAKQKKIEEVSRLYGTALSLMTDVRDLCEIVNKAIECGYAIEDNGGLIFRPLDGCPQLRTEGCRHKLGFYGKPMIDVRIDFSVRYNKIGYKNGGYDGPHDFYSDGYDIYFGDKSFKEYDPDFVMYDRCGCYWTKGVEQLKSFLREFLTFKSQVLDFVNNIEQYKCWK